MNDPWRKPVVLAVNQDAGIRPGRSKGAAVHLDAMRTAFSGLGADCLPLDEPDDNELNKALITALANGPVDLVYERYALGKSTAARFTAEQGIPLVLEVNSPLADEQARWRGGSDQEQDIRNDAFTFGRAHRVIAVSTDVANYAVERGAHPGRVEVFPNGIDTGRFNQSQRYKSVRKSLIPEGRFVIGFHGRERPWHGFPLLVEVICRLLDRDRDVHLLVVGKGDFAGLNRLPEERYTRVGWQSHEVMPAYVAAFDALPLTYDADMPCYFSPLKLMEAMGCGVVPVVPSLGDLAQVVHHGETGLVYTPGDQEQLLMQLETLIADRDLHAAIGQRAAVEASKHSWSRIARHVLASVSPMKGQTLSTALQKLRDLDLDSSMVRRVNIERDGAVQLEVEIPENQRYFLYTGQEFKELFSHSDGKIPLTRTWQSPATAANHEIISYRPGRRLVCLAKNGQQTSVIKAYKKRRSKKATAKYLLAQKACEHGGFDIPVLLKSDHRLDFLQFERRTGTAPPIDQASAATWSRIGQSLRRFQNGLTSDEAMEAFDCNQELSVLQERARRYLLCMPEWPAGWQTGFGRLKAEVAGLPEEKTGLAHRDLHDRQFIVSGESVCLLDFDLLCLADVALDAANLLAHMRLRALQAGKGPDDSGLQVCTDAFLSGFGRQGEAGFVTRLWFYQAATYFRLALIYAIRPRWSHLVSHLIAEGENCLNQLSQPGSSL